MLTIHTSFSKKINFNDLIKSNVKTNIEKTIKQWSIKIGGIFNSSISVENTISVIFNWTKGVKDIYSQTLLKSIINSIGNLKKDVTISIGVTFSNEDFNVLLNKSLKILEISKNRGGDQIVLEKSDGVTEYIGVSTSQSSSSNVLLDIKKFYTLFMNDVKKAREVFITSHKTADLDSVGSVLGIWQLVKTVNNNVYIIMDSFDLTSQKLFNSLPKNQKDLFISEKDAKQIISNKSHIIITDISNFERTQANFLVRKVLSNRISIIDHHRLNKGDYNFDESRIIIDTSISSSSEIVVEMLKNKFGQDAQSKINKHVSTALLSGIRLDSKHLTKNVTNSTFEAISFLINNDANTQETLSLFKPTQDLIKIEGEAFKNIETVSKGIIFTFVDENIIISDNYTSIIADKLLQYDGVKATFVLAKVSNNMFKLSARSNDTINVQNISEELGGGGHFNMAATSWETNIKFSTIKKRIIYTITKGVK